MKVMTSPKLTTVAPIRLSGRFQINEVRTSYTISSLSNRRRNGADLLIAKKRMLQK